MPPPAAVASLTLQVPGGAHDVTSLATSPRTMAVPGTTEQLTIFYSGSMVKFDNVPREKIRYACRLRRLYSSLQRSLQTQDTSMFPSSSSLHIQTKRRGYSVIRLLREMLMVCSSTRTKPMLVHSDSIGAQRTGTPPSRRRIHARGKSRSCQEMSHCW
ncbi:protein TIFY 8 isoform 1 [Oryza sativa Japonica Group]|uniref:Protein TIFY 8 n=2 Tax=Oryza sativa subsp. japonica TaxID=39947 RepID=TIF8_ORYSJ|nr:protein TIFY 8 isoform 1 [Oryza sativa Japonica Group]Q6Z2K1.1 RecName: Full=Protein TIFY 8; Short=OsTIFY8 [Oryza sativa Japonica Group]KAB8088773.1 hypothetical protein EE612_013489 [Oryza sativa]BAD16139.1 unknown protein [Oryza sativa Japonica Group]BAF09940.1 Os02g0732400 [Oryza sativa Japonica Group]BAG97910.1 unnamed protein product [Oryza sativa Japonica Group]BAS80766.1 Os02g0732400 [Oryza sativa Japonica Group]|eukprot:NP_001048026.1 Os02g0732400 [Oryza sativa Japonica Group]